MVNTIPHPYYKTVLGKEKISTLKNSKRFWYKPFPYEKEKREK
jgi:hypothetical protein